MNENDGLKVPIVIIFFNRPDAVRRQFEVMRAIQCRKLYLVADGPRNEEDSRKLDACKQIWQQIDWNCDIITIYEEKNLGCDIRIKTALDIVFQQEEEAIILEDDCIADKSFFPFCRYLLEKYREHQNISYIAGSNQIRNYSMQYSYDYIMSAWTWGWATWRRAWQTQEDLLNTYEKTCHILRKQRRLSYAERRNKLKLLESYKKKGQLLPWDYNFTISMLLQDKFSIVPCVNLISNCGFSSEATHTQDGIEGYDGKTEEIRFPLSDPPAIRENRKYQEKSFRFLCPSLWTKVKDKDRWKRLLLKVWKSKK